MQERRKSPFPEKFVVFLKKNEGLMKDSPPPTITRAALESFEKQSGLKDVARFLQETGRVIVSDRASGSGTGMDNGIAIHS
jgi:hypothetical protein